MKSNGYAKYRNWRDSVVAEARREKLRKLKRARYSSTLIAVILVAVLFSLRLLCGPLPLWVNGSFGIVMVVFSVRALTLTDKIDKEDL